MDFKPLFSEDLGQTDDDRQVGVLKRKFPDYDRGYICQAVSVTRKKAREWLEDLWKQYAPFADGNFLKEFRTSFAQRAWELYLGATILNRGYWLGSHSDNGPDLDVLDGKGGSRLAWIEAISVQKGTGPDSVPEMNYNGVVVDVPADQMSLRITQALKDKHDQYLGRLGKTVKEDEPYIIAIDRSGLDHVEHIPLALRVLYGIGNPVLRIPVPTVGMEEPRDLNKAEFGHERQAFIPKKSGQEISSTFFLDPSHAGISAVIYSSAGILNVPRHPDQLGENFLIAHNPYARNPVVGKLSFGEEWTGDETGAWRIRERKGYEKPDPFDFLEGN